VLEEVCESGAPMSLVPGPDAVPQIDGHDRDRRILREYDSQAVAQRMPVGEDGKHAISLMFGDSDP
jgi:hypothetical protein